MPLEIKPPLPPMEATSVDEIPTGEQWQYEPKWDGFRCLAFRDDDRIQLQSKSGQPLERYFPELVEALSKLKARRFVLDGEIVVPIGGQLSFDNLLMRIHPAASRVRKLAAEHPATFIVFDLLADERGKSLLDLKLTERRKRLERFATKYFRARKDVRLSPMTRELSVAKKWFGAAGAISMGSLLSEAISRISRAIATECRRSNITARPIASSADFAMRRERPSSDRCC